MIFVENDSIDAAFHFSVEEYFTRYVRKNVPVIMLWQADKTVMLGNNQVASAEVELDFAKESGINIVRRSSGGGAIYTDMGTVLYTVIEPVTDDIKSNREAVAGEIIEALGKMGVSAVREGRNDILIDGCKISGFAQYTSGEHVCTHGSLLFNADLDTLTKVLIPNETKLKPKGIASIRSRVTNIKPYIKANFTVDDFIENLKGHLLSDKNYMVYKINTDELAKINTIYNNKYGNREWSYKI